MLREKRRSIFWFCCNIILSFCTDQNKWAMYYTLISIWHKSDTRSMHIQYIKYMMQYMGKVHNICHKYKLVSVFVFKACYSSTVCHFWFLYLSRQVAFFHITIKTSNQLMANFAMNLVGLRYQQWHAKPFQCVGMSAT